MGGTVTPPVVTMNCPGAYSIVGATQTYTATSTQTATITFYFDGTLVQTNSNVTQATYPASTEVAGEHTICVVAQNDNGSSEVCCTWNVIIPTLTPSSSAVTTSTTGGNNGIQTFTVTIGYPATVTFYLDGVQLPNTSVNQGPVQIPNTNMFNPPPTYSVTSSSNQETWSCQIVPYCAGQHIVGACIALPGGTSNWVYWYWSVTGGTWLDNVIMYQINHFSINGNNPNSTWQNAYCNENAIIRATLCCIPCLLWPPNDYPPNCYFVVDCSSNSIYNNPPPAAWGFTTGPIENQLVPLQQLFWVSSDYTSGGGYEFEGHAILAYLPPNIPIGSAQFSNFTFFQFTNPNIAPGQGDPLNGNIQMGIPPSPQSSPNYIRIYQINSLEVDSNGGLLPQIGTDLTAPYNTFSNPNRIFAINYGGTISIIQ